ncbi:MAG: helix-turn-helix transcriptional regulator [Ilumatobacteraceae bacterium]|nr:helix-turn-helix transcriptional regulator [Ilumatobacteraceae bacterium]
MTNDSGRVFQETDVVDHIRPSSSPVTYAEFPMDETHGIALWPKHRLLADSRGLGWHDAYTSLATEAPWRRTLHAVPHYCIAYCSNRAAAVTRVIDQEGRTDSVELRPRHFGVVPANRSSSWQLTGSPDIQLIYLRRGMVDRVAEEQFGLEPSRVELLPKLGFSDGLLEQLALALLNTARNDATSPSDGIYADHLVRLITMHLLRCHSTGTTSTTTFGIPCDTVGDAAHARMSHVRDLIESALGEDLALERLATEAGIAPHTFAAAFTKVVGMPPYRYVILRRVERTKKLLRHTDLPISRIAYETGFASQSHLATTFKRIVGQTPGAYRRSVASRTV